MTEQILLHFEVNIFVKSDSILKTVFMLMKYIYIFVKYFY